MNEEKTTTLEISGMGCQHCVDAVEGALSQLNGLTVESVKIGEAQVRWNSEAVSQEKLATTLKAEGYALEDIR